MNDERIIRELNQAKIVVLTYVFIVSLLLFLIRLIMIQQFTFLSNIVELYIIILSGILLIYRMVITTNGNDERTEKQFESAANVFFFLTLYGAFFLHFASAAYGIRTEKLYLNPTSILIVIGAVIFLYQLHKRSIYFHYNSFLLNPKQYRHHIWGRVAIFCFFFLFNLIPFFVFGSSIIIGSIAVILSMISLSTYYLIFAFYEYHTYTEEEMLEEGKLRNLTKNAALLYILTMIFNIIVGFFSFIMRIFFANYSHIPNRRIQLVGVINKLFSLNSLPFTILFTLTLVMIYGSMKKHHIAQPILKWSKIYIVSNFIFSMLAYIVSVIITVLNLISIDESVVLPFIQVSGIISRIISVLFIIFFLIIVWSLRNYKIPYINYLYVFAVVPLIISIIAIISNHFHIIISLEILTLLLSYCSFICFFIFLRKNGSIIQEIPIKNVETEDSFNILQ